MNIAEAIVMIPDLLELKTVSDSIKLLVQRQRRKLLEQKKKSGMLVGFTYSKGKGSRRVSVNCNGLIIEFKNADYCIVSVTSPMKFASAVVEIDMDLLQEPFDVTERIDSALAEPEPDTGGGQDQDDDPLGGFGL